MAYDVDAATRLWAEAFRLGEWKDRLHALRIAGEAGLGVLTVDAMNQAMKCVRANYALVQQLSLDECAFRGARCLVEAANRFPKPSFGCAYARLTRGTESRIG